jgi:hypothetical protein
MGPSDFRPFTSIKKHVAGKQFTVDTNVKQAVTSWLQTLNTSPVPLYKPYLHA